jgi:uncharacterized protein YcbK (DUF882 family)
MKKISNYQLEKNFNLYEFIEGKALPKKAINMNWNYINNLSIDDTIKLILNIKDIAKELQKIRDKYKKSITITSGFRCLEWEKHQKRSGKSQHIIGNCVDFYINDKNIMQEVFNELEKEWNGGYAKGNPFTFIHIDLRGYKQTWEYKKEFK